jgi:hypothetical protein
MKRLDGIGEVGEEELTEILSTVSTGNDAICWMRVTSSICGRKQVLE